MAFAMGTVGDAYHFGWNQYTKVAKSTYTTPKAGDLVILSSVTANEVDILAANTNPAYIVDSINQGNGLLTVTRLVVGACITLPYTGSVALGDKVEGDGTANTHSATLDRSSVRTDNVNGVGTVIAVDTDTNYGVGLCVVEF